jgi:hypothetical protein
MRLSDNATLKFAVGVVRELLAIRALDCLTFFQPELVVTIELTTLYRTAGIKLNTDIAIQLGDCVCRERQAEYGAGICKPSKQRTSLEHIHGAPHMDPLVPRTEGKTPHKAEKVLLLNGRLLPTFSQHSAVEKLGQLQIRADSNYNYEGAILVVIEWKQWQWYLPNWQIPWRRDEYSTNPFKQ